MTKKAWISQLKSRFVKSPLVSNVFFSFLLTVLEKVVEMEFVCPCDSANHNLFTVGVFGVPAFMVFLLMIYIQGYKKRPPGWMKILLYSVVPAVVWLILLFFDGRYFACLMTNWSGRFVIVPDTAPWKWCKPPNYTSSSGDELQKTLQWYSQSQDIGMGLVMSITIFLWIYLCIMCKRGRKKVKSSKYSPSQCKDHRNLEAPVPEISEDTTV